MIKDLNNLTFILGGARSGKSSYAEKRAKEFREPVIYCATAEVLDDEMRERVRLHREQRPAEWHTVEAPRHAAAALEAELSHVPAGCVLLDCLSVLTSNVLLTLEEDTGEKEAFAVLKSRELDALLDLIARTPETHWLIVSNEVGMGVVPAYKLGRTFRDMLGRANQTLAAAAGEVIFMIAGIPMTIKGTRS